MDTQLLEDLILYLDMRKEIAIRDALLELYIRTSKETDLRQN
jgi:hypothetical protein